jgi:hypothetical protein
MYESLKLLKIPTNLIRLVKTTSRNSRAVVDVYQGRTEVFNINNGLRHGDALSILLFNLLLEAALLRIDLRGNISTRTKQLCACADDVVIIARTQKAQKETFIALQAATERLGLIINKNNTKYLQLTRKTSTIKQAQQNKHSKTSTTKQAQQNTISKYQENPMKQSIGLYTWER